MAMTTNDNDIVGTIADYCNDRLGPKDRTEFERLLREDKTVEEEYNDFRRIQKAYRQIDSSEPAPSEAIFDRISQAVQMRRRSEEQRSVVPGGVRQYLTTFWRQLRGSVAVPWMFAAAQAVVIVLMLAPLPRQTSYSTLSSGQIAADATAADGGINVVFRATATEREIRALLHAIGGSVVSGPSQEGRYVISCKVQEDLNAIIHKMRQSPIVAFAEPVR